MWWIFFLLLGLFCGVDGLGLMDVFDFVCVCFFLIFVDVFSLVCIEVGLFDWVLWVVWFLVEGMFMF